MEVGSTRLKQKLPDIGYSLGALCAVDIWKKNIRASPLKKGRISYSCKSKWMVERKGSHGRRKSQVRKDFQFSSVNSGFYLLLYIRKIFIHGQIEYKDLLDAVVSTLTLTNESGIQECLHTFSWRKYAIHHYRSLTKRLARTKASNARDQAKFATLRSQKKWWCSSPLKAS